MGPATRGIAREQIPLAARIFAAVDIWDALRFDRPYRKGWPDDQVIEHIRSLSGTHLDPQVVDVFLQTLAENKPPAPSRHRAEPPRRPIWTSGNHSSSAWADLRGRRHDGSSGPSPVRKARMKADDDQQIRDWQPSLPWRWRLTRKTWW